MRVDTDDVVKYTDNIRYLNYEDRLSKNRQGMTGCSERILSMDINNLSLHERGKKYMDT